VADVFEVLRHDHDEIKTMLTELEAGLRAAAGANPRQLKRRQNMAEQLITEASRHEAVEEEYFWPAVRERVPGGSELADTALRQEQEAKRLLDRIGKLDAADEEFEELLTRFTAGTREHMSLEEARAWPGLRQVLSQEQAAELGQKLEWGKKVAPTRPRPGTPPTPGVLRAAP
jgi:hemerythrin-like domain-containing protein